MHKITLQNFSSYQSAIRRGISDSDQRYWALREKPDMGEAGPMRFSSDRCEAVKDTCRNSSPIRWCCEIS